MKRQIGFALCGLAFGVTARYFFPGHPSGGYLLSAALGAVGAWLAELLGERAHLYRAGQIASFVMAILGSMLLMLAYGVARSLNNSGHAGECLFQSCAPVSAAPTSASPKTTRADSR